MESSKPHFSGHFKGNDPASKMPTDEIALIEPSRELVETHEEVGRLKYSWKFLNETERMQRGRLQSCATIGSPVGRMPPDLLEEIFYHTLSTDQYPTMSALEAPLLLTHVCSTWRTMARSFSRLWASLHISLHYDNLHIRPMNPSARPRRNQIRNSFENLSRMRCEAIKGWLEHSGESPLSLSLSFSLCSSPVPLRGTRNFDYIHGIFKTIILFSTRWKNLNLRIPFNLYEELRTILSAEMLPIQNLKSLRVNLEHSRNRFGNYVVELLSAPNLKDLSYSTSMAMTLRCIPSFWQGLTHLYMGAMISQKALSDILTQCINLVSLTLFIKSFWEHERQIRMMCLPFLESLAIEDAGEPVVTSDFFKAFNVPVLKAFEYSKVPRFIENGSHEPLPTSLFSFFEILPDGAKLVINPNGIPKEEFLRCIQIARNITYLIIGKELLSLKLSTSFLRPSPLDEFYLMKLSIAPFPNLEDILLPKLEVLQAYTISSFTDDNVLQLVISRLDAWKRGEVAALKHIKIGFRRHRQREDIEQVALSYAKSLGVDVKLELEYSE